MENQQENHKPERVTLEEKLGALQISKDDFHFYTSTFVQDRSRYLIKEEGQSWREVKTKNGKSAPLADNIVASHLSGLYEIATAAPMKARHCCIIVQYVEEFRHLYGRIASYLKTPLVFYDRRTKRLHYYCHFDFLISPKKLFLVMSWELDHIGIMPQLSSYQIFPHRPLSMRLPLGKDSFLIDPQTVKVVCNGTELKEAIGVIRERLTYRSFKDLFPTIPDRNGTTTDNHRFERYIDLEHSAF